MSDQIPGNTHTDPVASAQQTRTPRGTRPREMTGRTVFALLTAFFGVVIGANAFLAHEALSTFGGVEIDSPYRAGQLFEREVAMAKAQDAQHWQIDAKVTPAVNGSTRLDILARDAAGVPLLGMTATALFARPTDRRLDRAVAVIEDAAREILSGET